MSAIQEFLVDAFGLSPGVAGSIESIVLFLTTIVVVYIVGKAILVPLLDRALRMRNLEDHARRPLLKVAAVVIYVGGFFAAFGVAGFSNILLSLATIAAAGTLAIGFAMQNVISNFVSGIFIFTDKPFRIGDWIEWEDHSGIVEDISFRVTRVRTFNNELLTVPNSTLTESVVKNPVAKDTLRLQVPFGIGYDDDIAAATEIILEEAEASEGILDDPAPSVRLTELGDSAVVLQARVWFDNPSRSDYVAIRGEYVTAVKDRFDAAGIDIPYPQRELSGELATLAETTG